MLTPKIQEFLAKPEAQRDYSYGALLLLQITGNKTQYRLFQTRGFAEFADLINRRLTEILEFRLKKLTAAEVAGMRKESKIIEDSLTETTEFVRAGRRADHDELPDEIQAHYKRTLDILNQQKELHYEIRRIAFKRCSSCRDSDMYPFVKEIIKLDKERLRLWQLYDSYGRSV